VNVVSAAYSGKGPVRPRNEDAFLLATRTGGGGVEDTAAGFSGPVDAPLFFFAADGMGGHAAGDVASAFVSQRMREAAEAAAAGQRLFDAASLEALVKSIHAALLQEGREKGTPDMGSTVAGLLLQPGAPCAFFNAGDSRVYRLRNGFIQQLSRDDSLASLMPGAAKNIITNAIGAGLPDIVLASRFSPAVAVPSDVFLICSDGVHGFVSDDDLERFLAAPQPPAEIARRIVEAAIANNSDDNCTAVVVWIEE